MADSNETMKVKILIVEDEVDIAELIEYNLTKEGYECYKASNGVEAVDMAKIIRPQLILMDIMMPEMDGIEACRQIKEEKELRDIYIAFLTARGEEYSEIAGFDAGADDYITKPIKPRVLVSRVKALLKRSKVQRDMADQITVGDITIDRNTYSVTQGEKELVLPKKEFELLYLLASKPGKVFTRDKILNNVWGNDVYVVDRTIDVHIRKIREKIGNSKIKTIKGVGYKFEG
jgi:two-component system alkaline phosphatase synthesis response regulator PhoP